LNWSARLTRTRYGAHQRPVYDSLLPPQCLPVPRALVDGQGEVATVAGVARNYASAGEDPLTGLATAKHLRLRFAGSCGSSAPAGSPGPPGPPGDPYVLVEVRLSCCSLGRHGLERALRPGLQQAVMGRHAIQTVLPRADTIAAVGRHVLVAIALESDCADSSMQHLAQRAENHLASGYSARVRVKPLLSSLGEVGRLIDELSRDLHATTVSLCDPVRSDAVAGCRGTEDGTDE